MRLLYACILITGFNLHWSWYIAAFVLWSVPFLRPLVVLPDRDEIEGWWQELRRGK